MDRYSLHVTFVTDPKGPIRDLADSLPDDSPIKITNLLPGDGERSIHAYQIRTGAPGRVKPDISSVSGMKIVAVDRVHPTSDTVVVQVLVDRADGNLIRDLITREAVPTRLAFREPDFRAGVLVRDWDHLQQIATAIEQEYGDFTLKRTVTSDRSLFSWGGHEVIAALQDRLTDEQLRMLEKGYTMGYFSVPQESTAREVAAELDVSQSTFSEKMHRAQAELLSVVFEDRVT